MSQARLSVVERGGGTLSAEQFVALLALTNLSIDEFLDRQDRDDELQNALARLGALHLRELDDRRGTKDSDVLETAEIDADVRARLLALAGRDSELHRRHRLYLEIVARAFPFLAVEPVWLPRGWLNAELRHFDVEVLDVVDVVVAKLARFHGSDRDDIEAMVSRGRVPHGLLIERFHSAVERIWHDARADDLPRIVRNLHRVERDMFDVPETDIELPPWVDG